MHSEHYDERKRWKAALEASGTCPSAEELAVVFEGSSDEAMRSRIEAHLAVCARCMTEYSLLRDFHSAAPRGREAADVRWIASRLEQRSREVFGGRPAESRRGWWDWLFSPLGAPAFAAAAAVVLLVIAGALYLRRSEEPQLMARSGAAQEVVRSAELVTIAPEGDLQNAPATLSWRPVEGAARYEVRLMEVDRTELWKSTTTGTSISLPPEVRARSVPGKTLLWQVTALGGSGDTLTVSAVRHFRVTVPDN